MQALQKSQVQNLTEALTGCFILGRCLLYCAVNTYNVKLRINCLSITTCAIKRIITLMSLFSVLVDWFLPDIVHVRAFKITSAHCQYIHGSQHSCNNDLFLISHSLQRMKICETEAYTRSLDSKSIFTVKTKSGCTVTVDCGDNNSFRSCSYLCRLECLQTCHVSIFMLYLNFVLNGIFFFWCGHQGFDQLAWSYWQGS